jgi:hypothetical protein
MLKSRLAYPGYCFRLGEIGDLQVNILSEYPKMQRNIVETA